MGRRVIESGVMTTAEANILENQIAIMEHLTARTGYDKQLATAKVKMRLGHTYGFLQSYGRG